MSFVEMYLYCVLGVVISVILPILRQFLPKTRQVRGAKNQILQYFDLNKDNISEMNIYTADDYYKIYTQIVKLSWKKNPEFMYYTINMDTYSKQGNYDTIQLTLNYSNSQSMVLKLYLTNTSLQDQ